MKFKDFNTERTEDTEKEDIYLSLFSVIFVTSVLKSVPLYAQLKPCLDSGSERIRFPVTSKIALHTAGRIAGSAGSPSPVGGFGVVRK